MRDVDVIWEGGLLKSNLGDFLKLLGRSFAHELLVPALSLCSVWIGGGRSEMTVCLSFSMLAAKYRRSAVELTMDRLRAPLKNRLL